MAIRTKPPDSGVYIICAVLPWAAYEGFCTYERGVSMFYLLSLITGILECGWIFYGDVHGLPLWQVLCFPLAYHLGNLFPKPFLAGRIPVLCMAAAPAGMALFLLIGHLPEMLYNGITFTALASLSAALQSVRSDLKNDGNRLLKRVFRVGGFAIAPVAAIVPELVLLIASVFSCIAAAKYYHGRAGVTRMTGQGGFSVVMIFHQLHYFFYAHITLAAVARRLNGMLPLLECVVAALLFCGTWITYMSVEPVVSRRTKKLLPVFFAGHIGISVLLSVMSLVDTFQLFVMLWLVTGFGGGVVYTIASQAKYMGQYDKDSMTVAENIGHTCGLLTSVAVAAFSDHASRIMLVFGAASALLAVIRMAALLRKGDPDENI